MSTSGNLEGGVELHGVKCVPLRPVHDDRGSFTEVFVAHDDDLIEPRQWSVVTSRPGTLRGMHLHVRHDEYISVITGRLSVGLHDLRPDSPTHGEWALYELSGRRPAKLMFPRGIVHGWLFREPTVHLQATSEAYATYGHDDNCGCHWSDPELGIEWPETPNLVAARADGFGTLRELRLRALSGQLS